jgi:hypothetical protein
MGQQDMDNQDRTGKESGVDDIAALFDRIRALEEALEPFAARGRRGTKGDMAEAFRKAAEVLPEPAADGTQADDYFVEEGRQQDA